MRSTARPYTRGWHTGQSELGKGLIIAAWGLLAPKSAERWIERTPTEQAQRNAVRQQWLVWLCVLFGAAAIIEAEPMGVLVVVVCALYVMSKYMKSKQRPVRHLYFGGPGDPATNSCVWDYQVQRAGAASPESLVTPAQIIAPENSARISLSVDVKSQRVPIKAWVAS